MKHEPASPNEVASTHLTDRRKPFDVVVIAGSAAASGGVYEMTHSIAATGIAAGATVVLGGLSLLLRR